MDSLKASCLNSEPSYPHSPNFKQLTTPLKSLENLFQATVSKTCTSTKSITMVCSENTDDMGKISAVGGAKCDSSPVSPMPNPAFRDATHLESRHISETTTCPFQTSKMVRSIGKADQRGIVLSSAHDAKDLKSLSHSVPVPKNSGSKSSIRIRNENFADHYLVEEQVGRGKFAVVKRCQHRSSGLKYAAKFLRKRRKGKDCRSEALKEVHMLEMATAHPRLVNLIEVFETSHDIIIVTEFAEGGELHQKIIEDDCFEEQEAKRLLRQVLEGVLFLHDRDIVHLDIKPQNILLTSETKGNIKLCDLGFARPIHSDEDVRDIIGTPDYVAPEILSYEPIHTSSDIWSIGVLTYVMLTGCSPFAGDTNQETFLNISQGNLDFPEDLFAQISSQAVDFISQLLVLEPTQRLSARDCLSHPWLHNLLLDSPIGQRRALTPPSPEALTDEPAKKCRCKIQTPPLSTHQLAVFENSEQSSEPCEQEVVKALNFNSGSLDEPSSVSAKEMMSSSPNEQLNESVIEPTEHQGDGQLNGLLDESTNILSDDLLAGSLNELANSSFLNVLNVNVSSVESTTVSPDEQLNGSTELSSLPNDLAAKTVECPENSSTSLCMTSVIDYDLYPGTSCQLVVDLGEVSGDSHT